MLVPFLRYLCPENSGDIVQTTYTIFNNSLLNSHQSGQGAGPPALLPCFYNCANELSWKYPHEETVFLRTPTVFPAPGWDHELNHCGGSKILK